MARNDDDDVNAAKALAVAQQLVDARMQQHNDERRRVRECERAKWLQQTAHDNDASSRSSVYKHAPRTADIVAQELALIYAITHRTGFLRQQLASSHTLSPLARWSYELQLLQYATAPSSVPQALDDDSDSDSAAATATMRMEALFAQDVTCSDIVYATGRRAREAATSLFEETTMATTNSESHAVASAPIDELLSFASIYAGVATRVTIVQRTDQSIDASASSRVASNRPAFGTRVTQLIDQHQRASQLLALVHSASLSPAP